MAPFVGDFSLKGKLSEINPPLSRKLSIDIAVTNGKKIMFCLLTLKHLQKKVPSRSGSGYPLTSANFTFTPEK